MPRLRAGTRAWTSEELNRLELLIAQRASATRVAAALNCKIVSVRNQARKLGTPFPTSRAKNHWSAAVCVHAIAVRAASSQKSTEHHSSIIFLEELVRVSGEVVLQGEIGEQDMFNSRLMTALAYSAVLGAGAASAADLSRPYTKAPIFAESTTNWSGFYVGGQFGGSWTNQSWVNTANNSIFGDLAPGQGLGERTSASLAADRWATTGRPAIMCSGSKAR